MFATSIQIQFKELIWNLKGILGLIPNDHAMSPTKALYQKHLNLEN